MRTKSSPVAAGRSQRRRWNGTSRRPRGRRYRHVTCRPCPAAYGCPWTGSDLRTRKCERRRQRRAKVPTRHGR
eukprot:scaffold302_cov247-Pinguiococcus_pyrenoidosus.AAC.32